MRRSIFKRLVVMSVLIAVAAGVTVGDSAALQEKLKQDVKIELTDVTIAEALDEIGKQGGVAIELSDVAVWMLPDGRQTRLSVALEGQLAEGLEQMLNEFLMRYAVWSESVVVLPRPELRHILGRPTPALLKLLKNIYTNQTYVSGTVRGSSFSQALINQLAGEPVALLPLHEFQHAVNVIALLAGRGSSSQKEISSTAPKTALTLAAILEETVDRRTSRVWYLAGPQFPGQPAEIHIVQRFDYSKALLGQIVDVSLQNEEGLTVLRKLTTLANFELEIVDEGKPWTDGSWLHRRISLDALNVTVREALNRITVALGGQVGTINYERASYEVVGPRPRPEGSLFQTPTEWDAPAKSSAPTASSDDEYVGKISIPMGEGANRYFIEFMLRERDLPDGLRRLRAEKIKEIFDSFNVAQPPSAGNVSQ